jgi:chloramphenicol O-acetyltransferase type A
MGFEIVENYYRQAHFDFFRSYRNPFYAVTFELDATAVKAFCQNSSWPVYRNLCYFFARAMQPVEDFRYRVRDDRIVLYDTLEVAATLPAPDRMFSFGYLGYHPDAAEFNRHAEELDRSRRAAVSLEQPEDTNQILFSAIPGVRFTGLTHATPDDTLDGRPRVAFGRFFERSGRLMVPVGLEVNHIFVDGAAIGTLVEEVQREYDRPH